MQLLKLEVRNWVHHRQRTCEFTRGLVAILGENGSGKSSLFGAIRWLLTGENPNYGVKTDNISQYAQAGESAYAELEFEHNGHIAVVKRYLLPEKEQSILTIDGVEAGRGDKSVTAGIEKLLGVDAKFISRFIIVSQTEIFSFIDDRQSDTDKFFQRLFNTAKADKCQDAIGKRLLQITVPEIVKTSAQIKIEQAALDEEVAALDDQMRALPTLNTFLAEQAENQKVLQSWEASETAKQEIQRIGATITQYEKEIAEAEQSCQQYEKDINAFADAVSGKETDHRDAKIALGHWENYKNIAAVKNKIQTQRAAVCQTRAENPEPPPPTGSTAEELRAEIKSLQAQLKRERDFVAMFTAAGVAECPTCHTPSAKLAAQVSISQNQIPELEQAIAQLAADAETVAAAEKARRDWESLNDKLAAQERHLDDAEADLTVVQPPDTTEEELQQVVADYEDFQAAQNELEPILAKTRERAANLRGALKTVKDRKNQLEVDIANTAVTAAAAEEAAERLKVIQRQFEERQQIEQEKVSVLAAAQQLSDQYDDTVAQERRAVKLRQWVAVAEQAREALKNAPRIVAQNNLRRLESAINELLQIFGVNFQVKVADKNAPNFIAEFYDGRRQPAQRLSIGQKTVLALAFRVAVNAMFAEEIGLLALDEPTASLDQPRIRALAPVLEKLRELSTAKGLQCLLVTHASSLSHLFESTIELEPPESRHASIAG